MDDISASTLKPHAAVARRPYFIWGSFVAINFFHRLDMPHSSPLKSVCRSAYPGLSIHRTRYNFTRCLQMHRKRIFYVTTLPVVKSTAHGRRAESSDEANKEPACLFPA